MRMRLAKITLSGFKSFADKSEITFDAPIVGIVGPNGCGKSNIVDGIKWVLGELSAKSLRGGAMMDMIFNGSATRKPSGMASVTLTFENPSESLKIPDISIGFCYRKSAFSGTISAGRTGKPFSTGFL